MKKCPDETRGVRNGRYVPVLPGKIRNKPHGRASSDEILGSIPWDKAAPAYAVTPVASIMIHQVV
jgi:hypothetical protein